MVSVQVIKDYKLIMVVMVLVMLDVALLVAWQVVDPFQRAEKRLVPEVSAYGHTRSQQPFSEPSLTVMTCI